jgi:hypothetical protein
MIPNGIKNEGKKMNEKNQNPEWDIPIDFEITEMGIQILRDAK